MAISLVRICVWQSHWLESLYGNLIGQNLCMAISLVMHWSELLKLDPIILEFGNIYRKLYGELNS